MERNDDPPHRSPRPSAPAHAAVLEQVGNTLFTRARNLERLLGIRRIHLKFEGGNPTGTQKDRVSFALVRDAVARGADVVTVASCGNYGASLSLAARGAGLRAIVYIPERFHTRRTREIQSNGAEIVRVRGEYEDAVEFSRREAHRLGLYDCNPGNGHFPVDLEAYGGISREIAEALGDAPATVSIPVSNGTTLCGVHHGFARLLEDGVTTRIPRLLAASSWGKNPIVASFLRGSLFCEDLAPQAIRETAVNEPLINWHSFDGQTALEALRASQGGAEWVSDERMLSCARLLREEEGLHVLPASAAALRALEKAHERSPLPEDDHVILLTGRRQ